MVRQAQYTMDNLSGDTDRLVSEFIRHESCPDCGSSDALSIYTDGHTYCFSCHMYTPSNDECGPPTTKGKVTLQGEARALPKRGLSEKTCQKYKIYRDGEFLRHYYYSATGALLGCKVKTKDKQFWYEGDMDKNEVF